MALSALAEVLHSYPVEVGKNQSIDDGSRDEAAVVLVIFNPVENLIACVGHKELGYNKGVE